MSTGGAPQVTDVPATYAYVLLDEVGRMQFLHPAAPDWGFESSEVIGEPAVPDLDPDDLAVLVDAGARVRRGESPTVTVRVRLIGPGERHGGCPADCEVARSPSMPPGWLSLTFVAADDRNPEPSVPPTDARTATAIARVASRHGLTPREVDIVTLLVEGYRATTMSRTLHLSVGTVRNYLSAIFHKVGVHGQADLVEYVRGQVEPA